MKFKYFYWHICVDPGNANEIHPRVLNTYPGLDANSSSFGRFVPKELLPVGPRKCEGVTSTHYALVSFLGHPLWRERVAAVSGLSTPRHGRRVREYPPHRSLLNTHQISIAAHTHTPGDAHTCPERRRQRPKRRGAGKRRGDEVLRFRSHECRDNQSCDCSQLIGHIPHFQRRKVLSFILRKSHTHSTHTHEKIGMEIPRKTERNGKNGQFGHFGAWRNVKNYIICAEKCAYIFSIRKADHAVSPPL